MMIDGEIIKETTECEKNFVCLSSKDHIYCEVEDCISNEIHFVKCKSNEYCSYKMFFGKSMICKCPTRKEIYNKYGF